MNFSSITKEYLVKLRKTFDEAVRTGEMTSELSYRPALDEYLVNLSSFVGSDILRVFEPKKQAKAGRPDWRFYNAQSLGVYGYIEAKGLDLSKNIAITNNKEQIESYLSLGQKLILTDGLDFIFVNPETGKVRELSLVKKPIKSSDWEESDQIGIIEGEFRLFFSVAESRNVTEEQLITECALRAVLLAKGINELADLPKGSGMNEVENKTIDILQDLKGLASDHHDPFLENKDAFASFIAQVLIFGLIYAHRVVANEAETPRERYGKIRNFWFSSTGRDIEHLKPFTALANALHEELSSLGTMGIWYEDCCLLLSYVELDKKQTESPDYHKLFESFLTKFDPKTRFDFGAFYTPKELAGYIVKLTESIIESELKHVSLYDDKNKLIDPCCGTGSFLEQLIISSRKKGSEPKIIGFEILPGPYALSHYRLASIEDIYPKNLDILLTNTLSDDLESDLTTDNKINLFQEEQASARELAKPPLTLIIGNPPSSDSFNRSYGPNFEIIQKLLEDFRPPENQRRSRQNTQKQIQNEYVKFLRWSTNKILSSDCGVISIVIPSSFAENPSFLHARKWLVENFQKFWILDLDQDARSGVRSSSIFYTLQGRMLFVAVRDSAGHPKKTYHYSSIAEIHRNDKLDFLKKDRSPDEYLADYKKFELDQSSYSLRPAAEFDKDSYDKFWSLYSNNSDGKYIFERHCSGVKLAPSSMFVHVSEPSLVRRSMDIGNEALGVTELLHRWYEGQSKTPPREKFAPEVRKEFFDMARGKEFMKRYAYRPFLNLPALISEKALGVLSEFGGGGTRYRPEIIKAFASEKTIGLAVAPSPRDIGEKLHRFTSFCWDLPDNDLCKRGNAHIFCNYFPEYKKRRAWDSTLKTNVNKALVEKFCEGMESEMVFYVYAVFCSNKYLDEFEAALFTVSGIEPKIPMPADPAVFKKMADIGKRLAELEKYDRLKKIELDSIFGDQVLIYKQEFPLTTFKIIPEEESLVLNGGRSNEVVLKPIPREILEFQVSGYSVLQQWLKVHTQVYSRSYFSKDQFMELLSLMQSLGKQMEIAKEADALIVDMLATKKFI